MYDKSRNEFLLTYIFNSGKILSVSLRRFIMNKLDEYIGRAKKIAILSHINPDADALCSSIALKNLILNNYDFKQVDVFMDGNIGELYDPITRNEVVNPSPLEHYDLTFVLDCPNLERTGKYKELASETIINIDHHETNLRFGTINLVTDKVSSTCEYLFHIANAYKYDITNVIAKHLYQGIITDTNCFTSFAVRAMTHKAVSELLKYKFDANAIRTHYFNNNSIAKTTLRTKAFKSMKFHGDKFLTMKIDYDTFSKAGATYEDTLGIVDNGINITGVEACAILIETLPNRINVSLRNKGKVDIAQIAQEFNGGGNSSCAAFQYNGDIKELEKMLVDRFKPIIKDLEDTDDIIF